MVVNIWEGDKKLEEEKKPELLKDNPNLAYTFVVKHTLREEYSDFEMAICPTCGKRTISTKIPKIRRRQVTEIEGVAIIQSQKMKTCLIQLVLSHKDPRYTQEYIKVKRALKKLGILIATKCDIDEVEKAMEKQRIVDKAVKVLEKAMAKRTDEERIRRYQLAAAEKAVVKSEKQLKQARAVLLTKRGR